MKLMDEVAGIVGARHCNTRIVTACVDAINFHRKIKKGNPQPNPHPDHRATTHFINNYTSIQTNVTKWRSDCKNSQSVWGLAKPLSNLNYTHVRRSLCACEWRL